MYRLVKKIIRQLRQTIEEKRTERETHQLKNSTRFDRYPEILSEMQNQIGQMKRIKVLSFGCSTGEECFSILKYFPNAEIVGVDINEHNIKKCKEKPHENIKYLLSNKNNIEKNGPYDLILAMSVFCKYPDSQHEINISTIYPFDKFNDLITIVAKTVKVGGYFLLVNSNYDLKDSAVGKLFKFYSIKVENDKELVPKFDKNGMRRNNVKEDEFVIYKRD